MAYSLRKPAVAGTFYPAEPDRLRALVRRYLRAARSDGPAPKAIIAPHAGYIYSGPVAASAYALLAQARHSIRRVILMGPAHWTPLHGVAASGADGFATPLGSVPVDQGLIEKILAFPQVRLQDEAHSHEHSLEVHLPFLQEVLEDFTLVPLATGRATAQEVGEVLEALWGGPETVVVVSSDLSHYHDYATAVDLDRATARAIEALRHEDIGDDRACGSVPLRGLLYVARRLGLRARTLDLRNSGDTAGPRDRVVGYGAWAFYHEASQP